MANTLPVFPPSKLNIKASPSVSEADTIPTDVPLLASSLTENDCALMIGSVFTGSNTSFRLMVMVAVDGPALLSSTLTVKEKTGFVSKSNNVLSATVISPEEASMAKVFPVFPAVMLKDNPSPSPSLAITVPMEVVLTLFSSIENV